MNLSVKVAGISIKGRRSENQDRIFFASRVRGSRISAVVSLADGMGGTQGGAIASEETIKEFEAILQKGFSVDREQIQNWFRQFLNATIRRMRNFAEKDPSLQSMGTTFVASILLQDGSLITVNIGDSRSYVITPERIHQITSDHTLIGEALLSGKEVASDLQSMRDYLTKALTPYSTDEPDVFYHNVNAFNEDGVVVIVCSDGLYKVVDNEAVLSTIASCATLEEALKSLTRQAEVNGSSDNISIAAMEVGKFKRTPVSAKNDITVSLDTKTKKMKTGRILLWLICALAVGSLLFFLRVWQN